MSVLRPLPVRRSVRRPRLKKLVAPDSGQLVNLAEDLKNEWEGQICFKQKSLRNGFAMSPADGRKKLFGGSLPDLAVEPGKVMGIIISGSDRGFRDGQ